jgi:hypothetical protein
MTQLRHWGNPAARLPLARQRLEDIKRSLLVHSYALTGLDPGYFD